nr:hypothetical protein [Tanacetum cinerariifolium]GEV79804.1 hypothetical protein [Tanacetum cinerariifolium]
MNPVATQQVVLNNSLVAPEKRLKIEKCNARIAFSKPQREETYRVTLDALKLSPCYPAFLITVEVPEVIHNQEFIAPPSEEELVTFIEELGYSGKCDMLSLIYTDQMYQPWRTFATIINRTYYDFATGKATPKKARKYKKVSLPSIKMSPVLEKEPEKKLNQARKPTKKSTIMPTAGVAIRDTPPLLEAAQVKEALKKSKRKSRMLHTSGSGDNGDDGSNDDDSDKVTKDDDEYDVESNANKDKEANDNEKTDSYDDENLNVNQNDDEDKEHEEQRLKVLCKALLFHLTLPVNFLADNEVASIMNAKVRQEKSSILAPPLFTMPVTTILETSIVATTTVPLIIQPFSSISQMIAPTPVPTTSLIPALLDFASLFEFDQRVFALEQELSQVKQVDHSAQILVQIPAITNEHHSPRIRFATQTALQSYMVEFEKKAQAEKEKYIDIIKKSVKEIIKDEVKI